MKYTGRIAWLCILLGLIVLSFVGCGSGPTAPSAAQPAGPARLALAGQSNSILLQPFLKPQAFYGEVTGINPCWSASGSCWGILGPQMGTVDALVWSQGEYDVLFTELPVSEYATRWADLVGRARRIRPGLLVVVLEMGPMFNGPRAPLGPAYQAWRREWAAQDGRAVFIGTADLEWRADEVHMTDVGYTALAARIIAAVEARR